MNDDGRPDSAEDSFNPYQAPLVTDVAAEGQSSAELLRRKYLSHEASVQSVGALYLVGGLGLGLLGFAFIATPLAASGRVEPTAVLMLFGGILQIVLAWGLWKLRSAIRIPVVLVSVLGLLAFPIGTLINAYILWLILSRKGQMVFSEEYRQVIQQTPHIKYRTSLLSWLVLILFLGLLTVGLLGTLFIG